MSHAPIPNAAKASGQAEEQAGDDGRAERVAKVLARAGVASRREVERLITAGRVKLNGVVLETPAVKVGPGDLLLVDGKPIAAAEATRVWRYHKPVGLVTTHRDPQGRPTVFEQLPADMPRVISVGRLDLNSEGLLLLSNDGELARALELPASQLKRIYRARARGRTTQARLDELRDGVTADGVRYGPIDARLDENKTGGVNQWITVTLTEGKNREVRKVLEALDLTVNRLIRLVYGPFELGALAPGEIAEVDPRQVRERLGRFIGAKSTPTGEKAPPAASRPSAAARSVARTGEPKAKTVYKAGWAKPKKRGSTPKPKGRKE